MHKTRNARDPNHLMGDVDIAEKVDHDLDLQHQGTFTKGDRQMDLQTEI
jgi:hypothetical protein